MDRLTCRHCGVTCMRFEAGEGGVRHPAGDCHYSDWEFSGRLWKDAAARPSQDSQEVREAEDAVRAILAAVRDAANGYHNSQQWGDSEYGQPSYWERIEQAEETAIKVVRALPQSPKGGAPNLGPWGVNERRDALNILRQVCAEHGDNDFDDDLHLGDAIEKHLWRHLEAGGGPATPSAPGRESMSPTEWQEAGSVILALCTAVELLIDVEDHSQDTQAKRAWRNGCRWLADAPLESAQPTAERSDAAPSPDLISQIHSLCVQANAREGNPLATSILAAIEAGASGAGDQGRVFRSMEEFAKEHFPRSRLEFRLVDAEVVEAPRGEDGRAHG